MKDGIMKNGMTTIKLILGLMILSFGLVSCVSNQTIKQEAQPEPLVSVYEPVGPPPPMAKALAISVVKELTKRGFPAQLADPSLSNNPGYDLTGTAETLDPANAPRVAAISWVLMGEDQVEIAFLRQSVNGSADAWAYGSPPLIQTIGAETAANLSPFLRGPEPPIRSETTTASLPQPTKDTTTYSLEEFFPKTPSQTPDQTPGQTPDQITQPQQQKQQPTSAELTEQTSVLPPPPAAPPPPVNSANSPVDGKVRQFGVWVDEVSGAPGDGNRALTLALIDRLDFIELPFARTPSLASHYIQGVVDVAVKDASSEHVTIIWVVLNAVGEEIGRVSQRNDIVRGTLHQAWSDTAKFAAEGGVEGISAILERDLNKD